MCVYVYIYIRRCASLDVHIYSVYIYIHNIYYHLLFRFFKIKHDLKLLQIGAGDDHLLLPAIHRDQPLNGPDPNQSVFDEGPDWSSWDNIGKSGIKVYQTLIFDVLGHFRP